MFIFLEHYSCVYYETCGGGGGGGGDIMRHCACNLTISH